MVLGDTLCCLCTGRLVRHVTTLTVSVTSSQQLLTDMLMFIKVHCLRTHPWKATLYIYCYLSLFVAGLHPRAPLQRMCVCLFNIVSSRMMYCWYSSLLCTISGCRYDLHVHVGLYTLPLVLAYTLVLSSCLPVTDLSDVFYQFIQVSVVSHT